MAAANKTPDQDAAEEAPKAETPKAETPAAKSDASGMDAIVAADRAAVERVAARRRRYLDVGQIGDSFGDAHDVGGIVTTADVDGEERVACPNCGRNWPYSVQIAGTTIPCSRCGYLVNVPLED